MTPGAIVRIAVATLLGLAGYGIVAEVLGVIDVVHPAGGVTCGAPYALF